MAVAPGGRKPAKSMSSSSKSPYEDIARHRIITSGGVDREGRHVVVFYAHRMPSKETIDHERLIEYMFHTLDNIVESDYTLVYFHYGLRSTNKPGMKWAMRAYRELDRSYKKNVKKMIIVHPTSFVRILLTAFKPLVSVKFGRKLSVMTRLAELKGILYMDQIEVPDEIQRHDATLDKTPTSESVSRTASSAGPLFYGRVFAIHPCVLAEQNDNDPVIPMLVDCASHVRANLRTVGVFRRSANTMDMREVKVAYDSDLEVDRSQLDVHVSACLIKLFFRELPEPLLTFDLYETIAESTTDFSRIKDISFFTKLLSRLPTANVKLLVYILKLMADVAQESDVNLMSFSNLATVIGPNLLWSNQTAASLDSMKQINEFLLAMLTNYKALIAQLNI